MNGALWFLAVLLLLCGSTTQQLIGGAMVIIGILAK